MLQAWEIYKTFRNTLVCAVNQEKALVGASSWHCETLQRFLEGSKFQPTDRCNNSTCLEQEFSLRHVRLRRRGQRSCWWQRRGFGGHLGGHVQCPQLVTDIVQRIDLGPHIYHSLVSEMDTSKHTSQQYNFLTARFPLGCTTLLLCSICSNKLFTTVRSILQLKNHTKYILMTLTFTFNHFENHRK